MDLIDQEDKLAVPYPDRDANRYDKSIRAEDQA